MLTRLGFGVTLDFFPPALVACTRYLGALPRWCVVGNGKVVKGVELAHGLRARLILRGRLSHLVLRIVGVVSLWWLLVPLLVRLILRQAMGKILLMLRHLPMLLLL